MRARSRSQILRLGGVRERERWVGLWSGEVFTMLDWCGKGLCTGRGWVSGCIERKGREGKKGKLRKGSIQQPRGK